MIHRLTKLCLITISQNIEFENIDLLELPVDLLKECKEIQKCCILTSRKHFKMYEKDVLYKHKHLDCFIIYCSRTLEDINMLYLVSRYAFVDAFYYLIDKYNHFRHLLGTNIVLQERITEICRSNHDYRILKYIFLHFPSIQRNLQSLSTQLVVDNEVELLKLIISKRQITDYKKIFYYSSLFCWRKVSRESSNSLVEMIKYLYSLDPKLLIDCASLYYVILCEDFESFVFLLEIQTLRNTEVIQIILMKKSKFLRHAVESKKLILTSKHLNTVTADGTYEVYQYIKCILASE